jgi:hypothetical protein
MSVPVCNEFATVTGSSYVALPPQRCDPLGGTCARLSGAALMRIIGYDAVHDPAGCARVLVYMLGRALVVIH